MKLSLVANDLPSIVLGAIEGVVSERHRAISLREAASIQSFRDGYEFRGTVRDIARQIENAVPVRLAERLGKRSLRLASENREYSVRGRSVSAR